MITNQIKPIDFNGKRCKPLKPNTAKKIGAVPVAGPYRPETEDWMLERVLADFLRPGAIGRFVLVEESGTNGMGHFVGLSVWRLSRG